VSRRFPSLLSKRQWRKTSPSLAYDRIMVSTILKRVIALTE
jgi:hypothetical protein